MSHKKYRVIAKTSDGKFVKYTVNNLKKFANFLDVEFGGFRWLNVYEYTKDGTGKQLANFTNKNRPSSAYLEL